MKAEITYTDNKGLHEVTDTKNADKKLQKKISAADAILESVKKKVRRQNIILIPIIRIFINVPVEEDVLLETDGIKLFYNPDNVISMAARQKMPVLETQLMHLLIHGIFGDIKEGTRDVSDPVLADACMDSAVNYVLKETGYMPELRSIDQFCCEEENEKKLAWKKIYFELYKSGAESNDFKAKWQTIRCDDHNIWDRNRKLTELINIPDPGADEIEKRWESAIEMADDGSLKVIEKMCGGGKKAGKDAGDDSADVRESSEKGNSYSAVIEQFFHEKEGYHEEESSIDRMLYSYSRELYDNVLLVEPDEITDIRQLHTVVVAIDTSGSCAGEICSRFIKETKNILRDISTQGSFDNIIVMQCDTCIQHEERYRDASEIKLDSKEQKMYGFGGTDFRPVFERIEELKNSERLEIDCLLYLSDGYGEFPEKKTDYTAFFVLSQDTGPDNETMIPEWIKKIHLNYGEDKI